jgi:hypothetical protein
MSANRTTQTTTQTTAQAGMRYSIRSYQDRDIYVLVISALPGYSAAKKLALIRLAYHVNFKTGRCNPAAATLANELGTDERGVRLTLGKLERAGLLTIDRTRGRTSNNFTLMVPSNPGENTLVEPGSKGPEPASPTRVNCVANPGEFTPLTAKNTLPGDVRTSPWKEGEREKQPSLRSSADPPSVAGAPLMGRATEDSEERKQEAASEEKEEKKATGAVEVEILPPVSQNTIATGEAAGFKELRVVFDNGYIDDLALASRLYVAARREIGHVAIVEAARMWAAFYIANNNGAQYLPKLSLWLADDGWAKQPQKRGRGNGQRQQTRRYSNGGRIDLYQAMMAIPLDEESAS